MAKSTRSVVFGIKEETTEGTLIALSAAAQFMTLREGFSFESNIETIDTDELTGDIGMSEGFTGKQTPSASIPKYFKHSGTEGTAPDYSLLLKSAFGSVTTHATQYNTAASSTAGTAAAAAVINADSAEGTNYEAGQALLVKDGTNGYSIRNIRSISTDALTLNFNMTVAAPTNTDLGKAIHYIPVATGHPSFSAHLYQASSSSAFHQAMAGCRTTSVQMEFPVNELPTISFDFEGTKAFLNPIVIDATNDDLDFNIGGSELNVHLTQKSYQDAHELATEIAAKMTAGAAAAVTCSYSNTSGKFTIAKASGTLQLLWQSGANTATSPKTTLGFANTDGTGGLSYTSATAQTYSPSYTPAPDTSSPTVVRYNELCIGNFARNDNRQASKVSFSISTPKTDVGDLTAETGVRESITLSREVTMSTTLILQSHEAAEFDAMINNTNVGIMFNHGPKSAGNWVPGKCVNIYLPNAKITKSVITDSDGYQVVEVEAKANVTATEKDIHINFV